MLYLAEIKYLPMGGLFESLKRNLFTMTEYDKYMDYFGLNEENKKSIFCYQHENYSAFFTPFYSSFSGWIQYL